MLDTHHRQPLRDGFGREISYLRLSVTDRCDLRCTYCMAEKMTFLPKVEVLSLEELYRLSDIFIARGVRKIRITGGEPLVRRDLMKLITRLGARAEAGEIDEVTITSNGTQLQKYAHDLKEMGVRRINISLDTLNRDVFARLTRRDALPQVLDGIEAALKVGLKVKINAVALKDANVEELPGLIKWAHTQGMDCTLIEVMPLGEIEEHRSDQYFPLSAILERLSEDWSLTDMDLSTGGPARYVRVEETGGILGFITPLTNNFCAGCNRVRVTCTGQIYTCLGAGGRVDLRDALRSTDPDKAVNAALDRAMIGKPERHDFDIVRHDINPAVDRHMSVTGG